MTALPHIDLMDRDLARALLEWQVELGASEAIADAPQDRFARAEPLARAEPQTSRAADPAPGRGASGAPAPALADSPADLAALATQQAAGAPDLATLAGVLGAWPHCELRRGARSCVFADGNPAARVMIVGEGPRRDEDQRGLPFVGAAGQLLDAMFAAIGLSRTSPDPARALYITNCVPWRPPMDRDPTPDELDQLRPFLFRHIELAAPEIVVLMGNVACQAVLERRGIMRLRGRWTQARGRRVLPMLHPADLLRTPEAKREAWADLLTLNSAVKDLP